MRSVGTYGRVRFAGPPGWRRLAPVTRASLVLTAAGYLLGVLFGTGWLGATALVPELVLRSGQVWRLVSYPLAVVGVLNLLFGLLLLWSFGAELEPEWGSRSYALFLFLATASAGLLGGGAALLFRDGAFTGDGLSAVLTAIIVAWTLEGPSLQTNFFGILPMTRKGFALLAVVLVALAEIEASRSFTGAVRAGPFLTRLLFVLGGIPVAFLLARRRFLGPGLRVPRLFRRRRFRVVRGEDDFPRFH